MAKTVVISEIDSTKIVELKKELLILVKALLEDEQDSSFNSCYLDAIDKAKEVLSCLKEVKLKKTMSLKVDDDDHSLCCPPEFRCPLSKRLMKDPVIISTGQESTKTPLGVVKKGVRKALKHLTKSSS